MERLKTILHLSDSGHLPKEEQHLQTMLGPLGAGLPHPPGLQGSGGGMTEESRDGRV